MCSVVEIKNESEYYITYHSPESLETVASQQQSLEYQHLFRLRHRDEEDEQSDDDDVSSDLNAADKDFSVEEIVTPRNGLSSTNDNNDTGGETPKTVNKGEEVTNCSDQEHVVDNNLPEDNELYCESAHGDIKAVGRSQIENKLLAPVNIRGSFCNI